MENPESITPAPLIYKPEESHEERNYELTLNNDSYLLTMQTKPDEQIKFKVRQINNISFNYYENTFEYEKIAKILLLAKNYYDNINKVFKFYDTAINKNKVSLSFGKEKKIMKLTLKKMMDFDEVECNLELLEKTITNEEMIKILFNEIKEMKINNNNNLMNKNKINVINNDENENSEIIKKLIKKNEELEKKINSIIDENIILKNDISELQNSLNELKQKNEDINFKI